MKDFLYPSLAHHTEIEVKRSRFIAYIGCAPDRQQALQFIAQIRVEHPQARHVCWAFIAGAPDTTVRSMSDDGEPSGTAGRPLLAVLEHSGWGEIVVAVVRYFGGTKLGMGGLQRAYSDAVLEALADCPRKTRRQLAKAQLKIPFADESAVRRLVEEFDGQIEQADYGAEVLLTIKFPAPRLEELMRALSSITAGRAACDFED